MRKNRLDPLGLFVACSTGPFFKPLRKPGPVSFRLYNRTKEIGQNPLCRGGISRWLWRLIMYRLTPLGRGFLGLTFLFVIYGSSSLDLQIFVPFVYAAGIWIVALIAALALPPRVKVSVVYPTRVAAGSTAPVEIVVTSTGRSVQSNVNIIPQRLSLHIDAEAADGITISILEPDTSIKMSMDLLCKKRGVFMLKGLRAETDFPLGLLRAYKAFWSDEQLLVYPRFTPLTHMDVPTGRRYQPGGVALASALGESVEYIGNRDYRDGDNIRDIDWRATARLTRPIVREYREEYFHRVGVVLDSYLVNELPDRSDDFENAVSLCAAVGEYMARSEYIVDIFAAGPQLYHLKAGRGLGYVDQILDILACLEPGPVDPFPLIEPELMESLFQITSVVCIFLDWDEKRLAFVEKIDRETAVKVVIVRDTPCTLDPHMFSQQTTSVQQIDREAFAAGVTFL